MITKRDSLDVRGLDAESLRKLDSQLVEILAIDDRALRAIASAQLKARRAEARHATTQDRRLMRASRAGTARKKPPAAKAARPGPRQSTGTILPGLSLRPKAPVRVSVLVRFTGNRDDLLSLGVEVRAQSQDVFSVQGTPSQIAALATVPAVRRIEAMPEMRRTVGQCTAQAQLSDVRHPRTASAVGYRGTGVIVGLVENSVDVFHDAFRKSDRGPTRVLYYWSVNPNKPDPALTPAAKLGPGFATFNAGNLYDSAYIDAALANATVGTRTSAPYGDAPGEISLDRTTGGVETSTGIPQLDNHGTEAAGFAVARQDGAAEATGCGAAPGADIVIVEVGDSDWTQAVDFIYAVGDMLGKPTVVSLSFANLGGPHDGSGLASDFLNQKLDAFTGRSLTIAAGNENAWWVDGMDIRKGMLTDTGPRIGTVASGQTENFAAFPMNTLRGGTLGDIPRVTLFFDGPDVEFQLSIGADASPWFSLNTPALWGPAPLAGGTARIRIDTQHRMIVFSVTFPTVTPTPATRPAINIGLRVPAGGASVRYWAWPVNPGSVTIEGAAVNETSLSDLACCRQALTCGVALKFPGIPAANIAETIAPYSGCGPTTDGRIKPEIVCVASPLNTQTPELKLLTVGGGKSNGYITVRGGTSWAAPLVAGAAAVTFEAYGSGLDQVTMKALLTGHAAKSAADSSNVYGFGRLRMRDLIDKVAPPAQVDVWVQTADDDFGAEPYTGNTFWMAPALEVYTAGHRGDAAFLTDSLHWGVSHDVVVVVRNRGSDPAVNTTVSLAYARVTTSPSTWYPARDAAGNALTQTVTVPAYGFVKVNFSWMPQQGDIASPPPDNSGHFCALITVDHMHDPVKKTADPNGDNAVLNNNVAQRNLHID